MIRTLYLKMICAMYTRTNKYNESRKDYKKDMSRILLVIFFITFASLSFAQNMSNNIQLNQLGFYPLANKIAVVTGNIKATTFYVISADKKDTVFKGKLSGQRQSKNSSTKTKVTDFSSLQKKGRFMVAVPGVEDSYI